MNLSRRKALVGTAGALLLAGCAVSTVDGVTTVTLNVATVNTYAKAIQLSASALLANPLIAAALGSKASLANALVTGVAVDIAKFDADANGAASLSFATTSVPAAFTSLENDAGTLLGYVKDLAPSVIPTTFTAYADSLETIVSLLLALVSAVAAPKTPMTEAQALAVVGLK